MIASERRRYILEGLNTKGILGIKETAKELGIAEITLRRDFEKLEKEGKLKRVQGGATLEEAEEVAELTMRKKIMLNLPEKETIGAYAKTLVKEGDCVFLDGGTTMIPLAKMLSKMPITIVTYNILALNKLLNATAEVIIIGGKYIPSYNMNVGPIAQEMLKQFAFDIAFIGCSGVNLPQKTIYSAEMESLTMKRIAMDNALKSYLLVDCTKFSKRGFFKLSEFSEYEAVICNAFDRPQEMPENMVIV